MADLYPGWRYHASEPPQIVNNEAEDQALGRGWHDAPVVALDEAVEDAPVADAPKTKAKGKK